MVLYNSWYHMLGAVSIMGKGTGNPITITVLVSG